jgi:hypothetical protein
VSAVAPDFRRLAKEAPPSPTRTWKARAHVVIGIRGDNFGNTQTINVANASAMEQENGNDLHSGSVVKLKHTAATSKQCVNLVMVSKGSFGSYHLGLISKNSFIISIITCLAATKLVMIFFGIPWLSSYAQP